MAVISGPAGQVPPTHNSASLAGLLVAAPADTTNGGLLIQGFGIANVNLNWVARVILAECVG
jgi:hypothetical protein